MHNINYFSDFIYCAFGRNYGCVVTQQRLTTVSANIDGGQPRRQTYGHDNLVYTDWHQDNFFHAAQQLITNAQKVGIEFDHVTLQNRVKLEEALPQVKGLDTVGEEMDDIAKKAMETYKDLMDLGMNIEARYSGRIFEVAATMMRNAVDAKATKMEKKLKMVELQLKKRKMDLESDGEDPIEAEGTIIFDRNELLKRIANSDK